MKTLTLLIAVTLAYPLYGQDIGQRVVITSSVGDTLDGAMRNHFGLFDGIGGFKWAVFYLENDSILNARVHYLRDGVGSDTVVYNLGTLESVHSALVARVGTELDSANVLMKDGTLVRGTILGQTDNTVVIRSPHLGVLRIPRAQIAKLSGYVRNYHAEGSWSFDDPNYTNSLVMPTANTLPAGRGYVGDYELVFLTGAVGVTDWFMINAGTLLIPLPAEDMIFDYGFKLRLSESPGKLNAALGLEMASGPGTNSTGG